MAGGRRVVVTGLGLVTPLGCGSRLVWRRLCQGEGGVQLRAIPPVGSFPVAAVPRGAGIGEFSPELVEKGHRDSPAFIQFALVATSLAVAEAGIESFQELNPSRIGSNLLTASITAVMVGRRLHRLRHRVHR